MPIRDDAGLRVTADEFAAGERLRNRRASSIIRAGGVADLANSSGRVIRYLFSDPSVARDLHTITGWTLDNFRANPVFLWAHQGKEPPIGRVLEVEDTTRSGRLLGSVEYADRDLYPFADTVFQLVRGGYINAVSTSWDPIKWKFSTDRNRPGGIDFELVDLLELSQVPVPALPTALATARANGIDTSPVYDWAERLLDEGNLVAIPRDELEALRRDAKTLRRPPAREASADWKVGASKNLPLNEDLDWDGPAAAASIFEKAGFGGDKPDTAFARKGFLVYDASAPELKGSYKLPFAKVIDGRLTALASGIRAAASRLPQTDIPADVADTAREVIAHYEGKMKKDDEKRAAARKARLDGFKRDLTQVAWLAYLLSDLDFLQQMVEWEAAIEEDGSPIPAQIAGIKKQLGEILVAMAGEEVAELVADDEGTGSEDARARCNVLALLRGCKPAVVVGLNSIMTAAAAGHVIEVNDMTVRAALFREGKVLSAKNEKSLRDAHGMLTRGCEMVHAVFDQSEKPADAGDGSGAGEDDDADARVARSRRERVARAHAAKGRVTPV